MSTCVRSKSWRRILFALALLGPLSAQTLTGVVVDPIDAVIPNAEITVTQQPSLDVVARIWTDDVGGFRVRNPGSGLYDINIVRQGFKSIMVARILVKAGQDTNIGRVKLQLSGVVDGLDPPECHLEEAAPQILTEKANDAVASLHGYVHTSDSFLAGAVRIT